jgi:Ca-activated chloride channel family protein
MKISRTMVFGRLLAGSVGILLAGSAGASAWSDLWYRPDQQGQHALQAGDSKRAAALFADPRRQAYAELKSEQYAAAAKRLEPFTDADSQYNRGNALAKSGDLQGALNAYDGALKHNDLESALRSDAQHNRDLVARQLQAQKDQQHSSSGQNPPPKGKEDGKPQSSESKDGPGASGSSTPPATPGSASPSQGNNDKSEGGQPPEGGQPRGSTPPSRPSSPSSPAQDKAGDEQRQANGSPQSTQDRSASSPETSQQQAAGKQANGGRQEPSPGEQSPGPGARSGNEQADAAKAAIGDSVKPQTEQQLALEQWLRQIPDDPGGLLRRKFMIEHLMKQQQQQQQVQP